LEVRLDVAKPRQFDDFVNIRDRKHSNIEHLSNLISSISPTLQTITTFLKKCVQQSNVEIKNIRWLRAGKTWFPFIAMEKVESFEYSE